jgi:hypothetical protein
LIVGQRRGRGERRKSTRSPREDIYGCLYFFLSEQLRGVADRLQTTSTSFFVQMLDACDLGRKIRDGSLAADGIPSSIRFDRIEVSNIIDADYVGLNNVLTSWSPLLCDNCTAAIVGYFMNWFMIQGDGRVSGAGGTVNAKLMSSLLDKVKQASLSLSWTGQLYSYFFTRARSGIT